MGRLRTIWLTVVSEISWRIPNRQALFLAQFSQAERGSAYDMLAAAELTETRNLRRKYLEHALDEARHSRIFRERALDLGVDADNAALMDAGYLSEHGIVAGETLFERLGELEFLAFVCNAESRALEQFSVYQTRKLADPKTLVALEQISKDEYFHMTYTRAALDSHRKNGGEHEVRAILFRLKWRRLKEAWLRFGRKFGTLMGRIWLSVLFVVVVGPFRLLARMDREGWHSHEVCSDLSRARKQF
jgi:hypothetical protein